MAADHDRKQERRRKIMHCSIARYLKKNDAQRRQIDRNSELKKRKSIQGFKPTRLDRMASLYRLRHHHDQLNLFYLQHVFLFAIHQNFPHNASQ